jgi:decaprenylphospho-beta-D-erythro-pentofuranosid-2-ulose 2-reductase
MAHHCARLWIGNTPLEIVLVGRTKNKLAQIAADLKVRSPETIITTIETQFNDPYQIQATVDQIAATRVIDIVLIAHGTLPDQATCQSDLLTCKDALDINGISPVLFAERFALHMQNADTGTLAVIGSVAGDRGRKSNYVYGAAKGLVTRYTQGLQHRLASTRVKVVLIKPGPTDTPMTAHLKQSGAKLAALDLVAKDIVRGIETGNRVVYTPRVWWLIMLVIRHLPHLVFRKLNI